MRYLAAPITEAVIEIRFEAEVPEDVRRDVAGKLASAYPIDGTVINRSIKVELENFDSEVLEIKALKRASEDETEQVLLGPTNLIVSQQAPYRSWPHFFGRFESVWRIWKARSGYRKLNRIGVRYINRLDIPLEDDQVPHETYFNTYVRVPDSLTHMSAYQSISDFKLTDIGCILRLISGTVEPLVIGRLSFLLDIDIARSTEVPQKDEEILDLLNKIRDRKNQVFEDCITEKTRALINGN